MEWTDLQVGDAVLGVFRSLLQSWHLKLGNDGTSGRSEARAELPERAPTIAADGGSRDHAFISYSHAADGQLAPALRNGLQRFAAPWRVFRWRNPVRALRIFQDQASLSANPALWPTIENALGSAEWLILLASPEAAQSPWVVKAIDFWCRNKRPERLLIGQTDGDIAWDHDKKDFDWNKTTALPRLLSGVFTDEPRWIDARWTRTGAQASLRDPRFRDLVAELAAPLRGIARDELIGEDIRQRRRGRRILPEPADEDEARRCLALLSGARHRFHGGVAVVTPGARIAARVVVTTIVTFERLSGDEVDYYLAGGEWRGEAGGYAIQGRAAAFVRRIIGSYSNVVGLPLFETCALLQGLGHGCPAWSGAAADNADR